MHLLLKSENARVASGLLPNLGTLSGDLRARGGRTETSLGVRQRRGVGEVPVGGLLEHHLRG